MAPHHKAMGTNGSPLDLPELIEQIVVFLQGSKSNLRSCSLVSHAWVYATQSRLFRTVSFMSSNRPAQERAWARLVRILWASPHLIRHIHDLRFARHTVSAETFSAICHFPFTHLRTVLFRPSSQLDAPLLLDMQQLFSLPTLIRITFGCTFTDISAFIQLWQHCSRTVQHLELFCEQLTADLPEEPHPERVSTPPIVLESLRISSVGMVGDWLTHPLRPFDFSRLKVLSMGRHAYLPWPEYASIMQTIQVFDFTPKVDETVNLSLLPNLVVVRIMIPSNVWLGALDALLTIGATQRIRKIIINLRAAHVGALERLDAVLAQIPIDPPPVVELEMDLLRFFSLRPHFRQLASKDMLSRVDAYDLDWFGHFSNSF
ncbi:hypothetical protein C8R43DRAFT_1020088 [Mycena crocata]|nr:hypothetical protein C8R43DRAFT_1020088 [Mycena crocata]